MRLPFDATAAATQLYQQGYVCIPVDQTVVNPVAADLKLFLERRVQLGDESSWLVGSGDQGLITRSDNEQKSFFHYTQQTEDLLTQMGVSFGDPERLFCIVASCCTGMWLSR
jgi:hypothetical protein